MQRSPISITVEDSDGEESHRSSSRDFSRRRYSPKRYRDRSPRHRDDSPPWQRRYAAESSRSRNNDDRHRYRDNESRGRESMNISPGSSPPRYLEPSYRQPLLPEPSLAGDHDWNPGVHYPPAPSISGGGMGEPYGFAPEIDLMQQNPVLGPRDVIHFELCTLIPPAVDGHVPKANRDRPNGCRTIFVGGLPDKISETVLNEVFSRAGPVVHIRICMNPRRNFAHIRFYGMECVENALFFSGYRIHVEGKTTPEYTGRMHVDYAIARDDQAEWEESLRHQEDVESASGVKVFSDAEVQQLAEALKSEFEFDGSVSELIKWLERGNIDKRNFNTLYSMLQTTISHMRRLNTSKEKAEDDFASAKQLYQFRVQTVSDQMNLVEKVFSAVSRQRVWDKFTKPQRKNIEGWKKQIADARANTDVESSGDVKTEATEMDLSDSEDSGWPKSKMAKMDPSNVAVVKEENETLRFQLDAYKNEVNVIKNDMKSEIDSKDKQLHLLQQTLQNLQTQILDMSRDKFPTNQPATSTALMPASRFEADSNAESSGRNSASSQAVSEREAKLIGVLTTFLHIHPMGAGIDYVTSYVQRVIERNIRHSEVEQVLTRYQNMFRQSVTGVGASMERKWVLTVFDNCQIRP